ncbi:MAG: hypothetical protein AB7D51_04290 [Desulfovibrionaceae bacterium]
MTPFETNPPDEEGILTIRVWGRATLETGQAARKAAAELVRAQGCRRILVDFRQTRIDVPLHEYMEYYRTTASHYPAGTALALVIGPRTVPNPEEDMELTRVLVGSGGMRIHDFRDMESARAWLAAQQG